MESENVLYTSPELHDDGHKICSMCIVFTYGMILFSLFFGLDNLSIYNNFALCSAIYNGKRPSFPDSAPSNWRNLIEKCWQKNQYDRPSFTEICDLLESGAFLNSTINMAAFNDYMKIVKPYRPKMTK